MERIAKAGHKDAGAARSPLRYEDARCSVNQYEDMCVHVSLLAEEEWKGLLDRTLELGEHGSVNNNDGEGTQNMNDLETHRVGVVGVLVDDALALVFPPRCRLKDSDSDLGVRVGASHENPHGPAQITEESLNRHADLCGYMARMGQCVLRSGSFLSDE